MSIENEPLWLSLARAELGTAEIDGPKSNPKILAYYKDSGNDGIYEDSTTAWCAAFCGAVLKRSGLPNTGSLAARSYLNYGKELSEPKLGCIVVFKRGNSSWEGHVAFYVGETATTVRVLGGNQSNRVSVASYPKSKLLGYRWPIEPTVEALRDAGSSDIQIADNLKTVGKVVGGTAVVVESVDKTGAMEQLKDASDGLGVIQHAMEGLNSVVKFASANFALVAIGASVVILFLARKWIKQRLDRHMAGHPIFGSKGGA